MKTWRTSSGYSVSSLLSGRSNAYLIGTRNGNILVDTGESGAYRRLSRHLNASTAPDQSLQLLVLTHTHYDHCQNAAKIKQQENCPILMSRREAKYVHQGYTPLPRGTSLIFNMLTFLGNQIAPAQFGYKPFTPDMLMEEEYSLEQPGSGVRVISTPGHTIGSISVIVDEEIAIVGDAMFGIFRNSIYPPFADDRREMIMSWYKLLQTRCELFLPGHGRPIGREGVDRQYQKSLRKYGQAALEFS